MHHANLLQFLLKEDLVNNGCSLFAEEVISKPPICRGVYQIFSIYPSNHTFPLLSVTMTESLCETKRPYDKLDKVLEHMAAKVLNTVNNRLKFLYRKQNFLSLSLRRLLCNALIQPHFDYACVAWYPLLNKRQSKRIQIAQNKCIRYCLNLDNKAHIGTNEFLKINWLPTKKRVEQCICANVFKFFNQMSPQYTAEIFHPSSSVHNTRRATQKLDLPFRKSCIGQKTLSYIGPKIWNNLPAQIKLSKSVNTFKHDIKKSFFDDLQKQNDDIFFYY